ncbi:PQQ-dependent sugar dehydrogenase [Hymenobacter jejuensis]|uniref:T9SS type A sorting domain-containing protein n=1 Tax=Hymenobacter jejuensis TaxID=2502781 RepID=A0A5B8A097_9BACT|nr:PQQ-dependent sugar dehydrogenase [Hymenobacter jejuensis]QDA60648.1 T9SS type A sorting domain-containing protein [Hymenobacter jejuensis]
MKCFAAFLFLVASILALPVQAQTTTFPVGATTITVSTLAGNLAVPWELVWGPDNFIWMTERGGRISRVNPTSGEVIPLLTVPDVATSSEGGLLGMALHPDFATSPYLYIVYNYNDNGYKEKLVRYTYSAAGTGSLSNPQVLLGNITATTTHSGSRLLILPDRTILMTTGDAQLRPEAQNVNSLNGKVLRLNLDGSIPANNPIAGSPTYSYGHRNPQGLVRAGNGLIYSTEHGQDAEDELNLIEPNRNYGWPTVEGNCNLPEEQAFCTANNVRAPLYSWGPTIAVAGLAYYDSPAIPEWRNNLLAVALKASKLVQLPLTTNGSAVGAATDFLNTFGRLRAICVSPQGRVYVSTSNRDGRGTPAATDDRILVLENRSYVALPTVAAKATAFQIWPNPARQTVFVRLPSPSASSGTAELSDALGRVVRTLPWPKGQTELSIPTNDLQSGVYAFRLRDGQRQYSQRVVIQ